MILKNKSKLRGSKYYIDSDLTDQELKIQKTLRVIAKNEKEKGKRIKVGFQKIIMDGKTMIWDKNKNDLFFFHFRFIFFVCVNVFYFRHGSGTN
ncbi:hypothetical protein QE152_g27855 [Popillia japonica]|uniref:Uncharacterized protein n=1 Tax=Popillia japonica TaxID=7064 RepID=A0AAW1JJK2_POPJA